jgi:transposase-like protein
VKNMAETEAVWEPTEYKSVCPHCSATNLSKILVTHYVCTDFNKEYIATVAQTEED